MAVAGSPQVQMDGARSDHQPTAGDGRESDRDPSPRRILSPSEGGLTALGVCERARGGHHHDLSVAKGSYLRLRIASRQGFLGAE
jgi:hypothetical protein